MIKTKKVAILLATYNGERYIKEQIESLLAQSYDAWELYIHDDDSSDGTVRIIREYTSNYPERIKIIESPSTGGAKNNFFLLMKSVDAPYIMFCDQDDVWQKDKIEKSIKCIKDVENDIGADKPALVFTDLKVVDKDLNVLADSMNATQKLDPGKTEFKDIMIQNNVTGCTMMINKACVLKASLIKEYDKVIMHDWWCALVAARYGRLAYIPETLILYRQHGSNSVGAKDVSKISYIVDRLKNNRQVSDNLAATREQARAFAKTFGLGRTDLATIYADLGRRNKIERIYFYLKNGVLKSGLVRNLGLMVWG